MLIAPNMWQIEWNDKNEKQKAIICFQEAEKSDLAPKPLEGRW